MISKQRSLSMLTTQMDSFSLARYKLIVFPFYLFFFLTLLSNLDQGYAEQISDTNPFEHSEKFKKAKKIYDQRTHLKNHKQAFTYFVDLAQAYPKSLKAQLWCIKTSYYLGHRLRDLDSKTMKTIFAKGMTCRKRMLKNHARKEEAQIWAILMRFKHIIATSTLPPIGEIEKVAHQLEKMVKKKTKSHFPYMMLGAIYRELPGWPISIGDDKKSMEFLKKGQTLAKKNAEYLLELAATQTALDQDDLARKTYQTCIKQGTGHPELQWEAGDARRWAKKMLADLD